MKFVGRGVGNAGTISGVDKDVLLHCDVSEND
jgi:hypothetical protein